MSHYMLWMGKYCGPVKPLHITDKVFHKIELDYEPPGGLQRFVLLFLVRQVTSTFLKMKVVLEPWNISKHKPSDMVSQPQSFIVKVQLYNLGLWSEFCWGLQQMLIPPIDNQTTFLYYVFLRHSN